VKPFESGERQQAQQQKSCWPAAAAAAAAAGWVAAAATAAVLPHITHWGSFKLLCTFVLAMVLNLQLIVLQLTADFACTTHATPHAVIPPGVLPL
jgi:hypothetical protein